MPDDAIIATVIGTENTCQWLDRFGVLVSQDILAHALTAAAVPWIERLHFLTPESDAGEHHEDRMPHLVDLLRSQIKIHPSGQGGNLNINFGKGGFLATWLEYGWTLTGHRPKKTKIRFIAGTAFVQQSFDQGLDEALSAFTKSFSESVDYHIEQERRSLGQR